MASSTPGDHKLLNSAYYYRPALMLPRTRCGIFLIEGYGCPIEAHCALFSLKRMVAQLYHIKQNIVKRTTTPTQVEELVRCFCRALPKASMPRSLRSFCLSPFSFAPFLAASSFAAVTLDPASSPTSGSFLRDVRNNRVQKLTCNGQKKMSLHVSAWFILFQYVR